MGMNDFSVRNLWQQHAMLGLVMSLLVCSSQVQAQTTQPMWLKLASATPLDTSYSQAYVTVPLAHRQCWHALMLIATGLEWLSLLLLDMHAELWDFAEESAMRPAMKKQE